MKKRTSNMYWLALATMPLLPVLAHAAEGPAPTAPTLTGTGVLQPQYSGLRIGDIAPQFAFMPMGTIDGPPWQSRNMLGNNPLMVLVFGPGANGDTTRTLLSDEFNSAARQLKQTGVEPVVVVSKDAFIKMEAVADQGYTILRDDNNALSGLLGPNAATLTIVAIDRAGFIRRVEPVSVELAGTVMRLIGDPTPKLEVGKPAPDFAISDMNGQVRRLADLRGQKNLLLTFFPKCFTGG